MRAKAEDRYWWRRQRADERPGSVNIGRGERILSAGIGGGIAAVGLSRRGLIWRVLGVLGGLLVVRAATGRSFLYSKLGVSSAGLGRGAGIGVEETVTVNAPVSKVYAFWRDLTNLPRFMRHVRAVEPTGPGRSHWVIDTPAERPIEWDAEIIDERENEFVAWRTLPGGDVQHAGSVRFREATGGRGTVVHLQLRYVPAGGAVGFAGAKALSGITGHEVAEELRRFKEIVEAGEVPTTEGQPAGRERQAPPTAGMTSPSRGEETNVVL